MPRNLLHFENLWYKRNMNNAIEEPQILTAGDCTLLTGIALSKRLNVSYDYVKDMRAVGFDLPFGGLTTLTHALDWLNANRNFREKARTLRLLRRPTRRERPRPQDADRCDEPLSRRDSQFSSLCSLAPPLESAA